MLVNAGLTPAGVQQTISGKFNYDLVVQVPVPWANLNLNANLIGDFILPALTLVTPPKAVLSFMAKAPALLQGVVDDATALLLAVPQASVTIVVKVGPAVVLNVRLVASREPVAVAVPAFDVALPNFAVDPDFVVNIPFPAPPPVVVRVPIPIPVVCWPASLLVVSGGQVTAAAEVNAKVQPIPVGSSVYLPRV